MMDALGATRSIRAKHLDSQTPAMTANAFLTDKEKCLAAEILSLNQYQDRS
ncbi:MAG: hypothetical protein OQK51_09365 [Kangiellaceae bacterium]|nr:hypothetical protein [Kangiellaceae bacterium]